MDCDEAAKLFVGGISRDTTGLVLRDHFAKYGTVLDSTVSVDRSTGSPRGFGFVKLSDMAAADQALQDTHVILGRTVDVKKAIPRSEHQQQQQNQLPSRGMSNHSSSNDCGSDYYIRTRKKIFVGGLSAGISEEEFKKYFERFGRITDVVVMQDSVTHRPRGFGFITFDSEESVEDVLVKNFHDLNGRWVEVKRAVPKEGNHVCDDFNNLRYKTGKGASKSFPHFSPRCIVPGYAPLTWYSSDGVYVYASHYGGWYLMGGYGGNACAVPSDAYRNFWFGSMVPSSQACQVPYSYFPPSPAYVSRRVGMNGSGAGTRGSNGSMGSAKNLKYGEPFSSNGFVPANVTSTQGVKQNVDSSSMKGSNGETSS